MVFFFPPPPPSFQPSGAAVPERRSAPAPVTKRVCPAAAHAPCALRKRLSARSRRHTPATSPCRAALCACSGRPACACAGRPRNPAELRLRGDRRGGSAGRPFPSRRMRGGEEEERGGGRARAAARPPARVRVSPYLRRAQREGGAAASGGGCPAPPRPAPTAGLGGTRHTTRDDTGRLASVVPAPPLLPGGPRELRTVPRADTGSDPQCKTWGEDPGGPCLAVVGPPRRVLKGEPRWPARFRAESNPARFLPPISTCRY